MCRPYLNADGLFILKYAAPGESYTGKVFAKVDPTNFKKLSKIPFHPDFALPPNWPGGQGTENRR